MRMMMKVRIPVEAGNRAIRDRTMPKLIEGIAQEIRPEAVYFFPEDGKRTACFFFDMKDPSQMPSISEPAFMELNAEVTFVPCMNREDLMRGMEAMTKKPH